MANNRPVAMDYRRALLMTPANLQARENSRLAEEFRVTRAIEAETARQAAEDLRVFPELEAKNILHKLSLDIRQLIWRYLFSRKATVLPGSRYSVSQARSRFQFTDPTSSQSESLTVGKDKIPLTYSCSDLGAQVGCFAVQRGVVGEAGIQIINLIKFTVPKFDNIKLLRVCKQIHNECAQILYGENKFAFLAGHEKGCPAHWEDADPPNELDHVPHWIPELRIKHGWPQSENRATLNINGMFEPDISTTQYSNVYVFAFEALPSTWTTTGRIMKIIGETTTFKMKPAKQTRDENR